MTYLPHSDRRPQGFVDPEGATKTPFRRRLEREAEGLELPRKKRARRVPETEKIPPPPAGYEKPATWKRVAESPEGTVLLATHRGWEPVSRGLTIEREEIKYASGEKKVVARVKGPVGRIYWRGSTVMGVKLPSLRVPGAGKREGTYILDSPTEVG